MTSSGEDRPRDVGVPQGVAVYPTSRMQVPGDHFAEVLAPFKAQFVILSDREMKDRSTLPHVGVGAWETNARRPAG